MTVYRQGSPILNEDATQVVGYLRRSIKVQGKILTFPLEDDHRTAMSFSSEPLPVASCVIYLASHFDRAGIQILQLSGPPPGVTLRDALQRAQYMITPEAFTPAEKTAQAIAVVLKDRVSHVIHPQERHYLEGFSRAHHPASWE